MTHQFSDPPEIWHSSSMEHEPRRPYLSKDRLWTEQGVSFPNCTGSHLGLPPCLTVHRMPVHSFFALIVHLPFIKFTSVNITWTSLSCHCSIRWLAKLCIFLQTWFQDMGSLISKTVQYCDRFCKKNRKNSQSQSILPTFTKTKTKTSHSNLSHRI